VTLLKLSSRTLVRLSIIMKLYSRASINPIHPRMSNDPRSIPMFRLLIRRKMFLFEALLQLTRSIVRVTAMAVTVEAPARVRIDWLDCNQVGHVHPFQNSSIGPHNSRKFYSRLLPIAKIRYVRMLPDTSTSITADLIMLFVADCRTPDNNLPVGESLLALLPSLAESRTRVDRDYIYH